MSTSSGAWLTDIDDTLLPSGYRLDDPFKKSCYADMPCSVD
jgi:hypothetical protein